MMELMTPHIKFQVNPFIESNDLQLLYVTI
jgi:hypothetical protein